MLRRSCIRFMRISFLYTHVLGTPVVPFSPFCLFILGSPYLSRTLGKGGTLLVKGLLGNPVFLHFEARTLGFVGSGFRLLS